MCSQSFPHKPEVWQLAENWQLAGISHLLKTMLASELISGVCVFMGNTGKADAVSLSGLYYEGACFLGSGGGKIIVG
jgi:hypothetical protein